MYFDTWENELYHHGIRGQKWGVRRFQNEDGSLTNLGKSRYGNDGQINRSSRGIARDLNRLDKDYSNAKGNYEHYKVKADKRNAKNKKNGVESDRKAEKLNKKVSDYKKIMDRAKKVSDDIINKALKSGYSISSRNTVRYSKNGKTKAFNMISGTLGAASLTAVSMGLLPIGGMALSRGRRVIGKKYKVKNDGLGIKRERSDMSLYDRSRLYEYGPSFAYTNGDSSYRRRRY